MANKTLDVKGQADLKLKIPDSKVIGNPDTFQLLCKASSEEEGWMRSTKAMEIERMGCVIQVTTQQGDNISDALIYIPGAKIVDDINGGKKVIA